MGKKQVSPFAEVLEVGQSHSHRMSNPGKGTHRPPKQVETIEFPNPLE